MDQSGIVLDQGTKPFERLAASERDQLAVCARKFQFDAETLRGNHQWVTITATDETGYSSLFVIAADQGSDETEVNDYQAFQYRAHGAPGQTEVIVGLLPRAAMRSLVRAVLSPESPRITLGVSACS